MRWKTAVTGEDLCYLSAGRALELFRSGELSPVALMRAIIERDDRVGASLNAFSDRYLDEALASASVSEARWMRGEERALEGVPVAVKDAQGIAGKRTTFGSPIYKDNIAANSDPMIERLANAGAIIHARTTTSEFCVSGICRSPLWGTTLNPWNRAFGPGGSSGGSAAALAGGLTMIATGTDMGGSIRVPASACGVVGFKPPHGRNPDGEPSNLDPRNHCGPLARTVRDIALVQNVVSGRHPLDRGSLRETVTLPTDPSGIDGLRVAFSIDLGYRAVESDVRTNMLAALEVFRDLDCSVDEVQLCWSDEIDLAFARWFEESQLGQDIARHAGEHPELLSEDMRRCCRFHRQPCARGHRTRCWKSRELCGRPSTPSSKATTSSSARP